MTQKEAPESPHLERVIGVGGLGFSAVNCIIGSGIFGLPGIAAAMLGPAALLAYLVCAVLIGLVGLCFAEVGSRVAGAGGMYAYATEAFGPIVGGIAGTWLCCANSVASSAAVANLLVVATATAIFGPWGTRLLLATTLLSVSGFLSADILCSPRNLHALADRRQLPRALAAVHPRFKTPALAVAAYAVMCALAAWSGSFRQLVIVTTSGTLLLYLICCLGLFRLRARNVAQCGTPFRVRGGSFVPLAASAIIIWMLSTLLWTELIAAGSLVVISGLVYALQSLSSESRLRRTELRESELV